MTFLFTDIEGSTRLVKALREQYAQVLAEHRRVVRAAIAAQAGHEVDTQGDAFFVAFASAKQAVLCAVEVQRELAAQEWPAGAQVRVRMGIHTGQATPAEGTYTGLAVHRAARICAAARGGQVLVSQATQTIIEDEEEEPGFTLLDVGEHRLKDLDRPVRLFQLAAAGLDPQLPHPPPPAAARPQVPAPAQLPADIADFAGRDQSLGRLCDHLSSLGGDGDPGAVRIAVVAGAGGLGKTALAVHAAHRVRASFPDGQFYVNLLGATAHPLPAADVLARFLRDLGVDGRYIPVDEDERAARYRTILAGRRMLVVLDNARDAAQARLLLPGAASSAVLMTTRSRMPDLASTLLINLKVLDDDEALALFTTVVGEKAAAAEPEATAELLAACACLPLAIRICAARLATRPGWSIQAMADRLRDTRRRLDELRVGDLAVRASFQVSFASLPARDQPDGIAPADAFRLLGLWEGPSISAAAAAALFGTPEHLAEDALEILVDAHQLDSTAPGRYRFHDLLRVYSSERAGDLPEEERHAAIGRLLTWYVRTADAAATAVLPDRYNMPLDRAEGAGSGPRPLSFSSAEDALRWYDGERANLVAATRQASSAGLHEIAWRLPAPLFGIFNTRHNWVDLLGTHRIALESARRAGNRLGEAWILNNMGEALGITGDSEGIGYLEQALAIRHDIGDRMGEAQAANNLGDAYETLGRTEEAVSLLQRALDLNRAVGNRYGQGVALANLGDAYLKLNRAGEAIDALQQASRAFTEVDYLDGTGYVMHILGDCYLSLGKDEEALDCLRQSLDSHRAAGNQNRQAVTLSLLATVQARRGQAEQARESWAQAAAIFDVLGDSARAAEVRAKLLSSGH